MRGLPEQRVTWHLENWAEFQRNRASDFGTGFNFRDGSGACSNSSREFDAMVAEVDKHCSEVVDTIIEHDLAPVESMAVKHFHLGAVFRLQRASMTDAYKRARVYLSMALVRRGIE
jgi:hypothetical protein